jgi:hypothetical protein
MAEPEYTLADELYYWYDLNIKWRLYWYCCCYGDTGAHYFFVWPRTGSENTRCWRCRWLLARFLLCLAGYGRADGLWTRILRLRQPSSSASVEHIRRKQHDGTP